MIDSGAKAVTATPPPPPPPTPTRVWGRGVARVVRVHSSGKFAYYYWLHYFI
jgi:hypothetical protein